MRENVRWCVDIADYYGIAVTVTSTWRSMEKQAELRAAWEAGLSRWPANRPGESAHNYGLAWDSVVDERHQRLWKRIREFAGWRVPTNDIIHAEIPGWRRYR